MSANLRKYLSLRQEQTKGGILYLGDISATINNIDYVSWKDWGTYFSKDGRYRSVQTQDES